MSTLKDVHYGKVFTHLIELLSQVDADLRRGNVSLSQITDTLDRDPVYEAIAAETFVSPVRESPQSGRLRDWIESIRQLIADSPKRLAPLEGFLKTIEKFLASGNSNWHRKHGFFIVPVIEKEQRDDRVYSQEGMVYLYSPLKQIMRNAARKKIDTEDLTQDDRVVVDFETLLNVMLKRFFYLWYFPLDRYTGASDFSYRLHFGCQITEGKSMHAAVVATYLLNYLQSTLGDEVYTDYVAPQVGTLLTGEIDAQGRVKPVSDLERKVLCGIREYGGELKVIIPEGQVLSETVRKQISRDNLFTVRSVEELMSQVLATRGDLRGLDKAREGVFGNLAPQEITELSNYLLPDVPREVYTRKRKWREPVPNEHGIHSLASAWNDRLDLAFGTNPFSLITDDASFSADKKLIQVILDGSGAMDGHWVADSRNEVSRIAIALYEIAHRIDPAREDLVFGFLSSRHFESYNHARYTDAKALEPLLQTCRKRLGLKNRGPFMRPIRQQSIQLYAGCQKRIYLLTESDVPDLHDLNEERVESLELFRLTPKKAGAASNRAVLPSEGLHTAERAIFSEELTANQELLTRYFHKEATMLPTVEIDVGTDLPILWEPPSATVSRQRERYVLRHRDDRAIEWRVRLRLANIYPHRATVSGTLKRDAQFVDYSFTTLPTVTALPPLPPWREGQLAAEEVELWKIISSPVGVCPECNSSRIHLLHESERNIMPKPVFSSLAALTKGWLLLCAAQPRWVFFTTGCQIAGLSIAIVDERPHYSAAQGHLDAVPTAPQGGGLYCLERESDTYYLSYI